MIAGYGIDTVTLKISRHRYILVHAEFIFLFSGRGMKRWVVFNGKARGIPYSSLDTRIRLLEVLELNHDLIVIAV